MDRFDFWQRWLGVISALVAVFGVGMALLNRTVLFSPIDGLVNPVFWGSVSESASRFQGWIYGVLGATMAGWGVCMTFVVVYPFRRREPWAWNCLAAGIALWYMVDTGLSAVYGVTFNVVFNTVLMLLVAVPLFFTRAMRSGGTPSAGGDA